MNRNAGHNSHLEHILEHHQAAAAAMGDISKTLQRMAPALIGLQTFALDSNGQASQQYRLPFRSVEVDSLSANTLTIVNQPPSETPSGTGAGAAFVRPGGFKVANMAGYTWSLYGGNPGELVTVAAYNAPQPPFAENGELAAGVSLYASGDATAPGAFTTIAQLPVLPVGLYAMRIFTGFGATAEATTANNVALFRGGTNISGGLVTPFAPNSRYEVGTLIVASDGINAFTLRNPVAASAGAIYQVSVQADRVR